MPERHHGTAIALAGRAALIRGPSGSGKSDLALRCILQPATPLLPAAALVADDQVEIDNRDGRLIVRAPGTIEGLIEVRGVGIVRVPAVVEAALGLIVSLHPRNHIERYPASLPMEAVCGVEVPVLGLEPFEASAPLKVLLALAGKAENIKVL